MPRGLASVDVPLIEPYARILRHPGAARFSAAAFVARLPISMVGLGIVLLIIGWRKDRQKETVHPRRWLHGVTNEVGAD